MADRELDVLVVGGGITGVGVALDAAMRGLRVGLVERDDFASGTSSRSSKMIHGGLRYLATGDVRLVREALHERKGIQSRAAHLVRPLPMLLPVWGVRIPAQRVRLGAGLWIYDMLGAWRAGVRHRWYNVSETTRLLPNVDTQGLVGALGYRDAQADDARLVMAVLRTAVRNGALVANHAPATQLLTRGERVVGARVAVGGQDEDIEVRARVVVNATGVWADQLYAGTGHDPGFSLLPSKGIHLTVERDRVGVESGVAFFSQTNNRNVFVEPWQDDLAIIGTTDTPYKGDLAVPRATEEDIADVLGIVNAFLRHDLTRDDVIAAWAGLRPLLQPTNSVSRSQDVSRRHKVVQTPGLVSLVGGKLTTYRAMAEDAVDVVARQLDRPLPQSPTRDVPLEGCTELPTSAVIDAYVGDHGIDRTTVRHLLRRYGAQAQTVLEPCGEQPHLRERLHPDRPYLKAEALYAVEYEMALTVEDIVHRRTRLGLETRDMGDAARPFIEQLLSRSADLLAADNN